MPNQASSSMDDVVLQLKIMNRLFAAQLKQEMPQNEIIALLASTGASNKEIAAVLGTSPATVVTALSRLRKK